MPLWPDLGPVTPPMISTYSTYVLGPNIAGVALGAPVGSNSVTAGRALILPLNLPEPVVIQKVFWITGDAGSGSALIDIGVYDETYNLIVSAGGVALGATATTLFDSTITTTRLGRGQYYIAIVVDTAGTFLTNSLGVSAAMRASGQMMQASAYPLPATLTPVVVNTSLIPAFGISQRSLVA